LFTVIDGGTWWRFDPLIGTVTNDGDPGHRVGIGEAAKPLLDPALMLSLVEDGDWGDTGWREVSLDGWAARLRTIGGQRQLLTDRDETRLLIQANNLDDRTMIAIAASLVEASTDPPTLTPTGDVDADK
jgi:hypothetical protein